MSEMREVFEPGDRIYTVNNRGDVVMIWKVGVDGRVTLVESQVTKP